MYRNHVLSTLPQLTVNRNPKLDHYLHELSFYVPPSPFLVGTALVSYLLKLAEEAENFAR